MSSMNNAEINEALPNWFTYHPPKGDQVKNYEILRAAGHEFADTIATMVPAGPERDEAIKSVRAAVMWANAGIACAYQPDEDDLHIHSALSICTIDCPMNDLNVPDEDDEEGEG